MIHKNYAERGLVAYRLLFSSNKFVIFLATEQDICTRYKLIRYNIIIPAGGGPAGCPGGP